MVEELQGHLLDLGSSSLASKAFYLDDGILAGDQESVAAALEAVISEQKAMEEAQRLRAAVNECIRKLNELPG